MSFLAIFSIFLKIFFLVIFECFLGFLRVGLRLTVDRAVIASDYDPKKVMIAALMTAAITIALTAYACTTDTDFTICGGLLFMVLLGLIVASIISIFWPNE